MTRNPFLDLPPDIRGRIYFHAGLSRPCPVTICWKDSERPVRQDFDTDYCIYRMKCRGRLIPTNTRQEFDCFCPFFPLALLRVCRTIYHEAIAFFYGKNKFQLLGSGVRDDLKVIFTLTGPALASMTSLLIRLNCWPCLRGHDVVNPGNTVCRICYTYPPKGERYASSENLLIWRAICARLANFVQPGQLNFTFISDMEDFRNAQDVCLSIKLLPRLKTCNIRLEDHPVYELSELARQTAQQQTGKLVGAQPFKFIHLPEELRLRILSFTHLGPDSGFDSNYKNIAVIRYRIQVRGHSFDTPRRCCWRCNDTKSNCCCPTARAAVSDGCLCRKIPSELFRVSKQMKSEAEYIFFSFNCFDFNMDIERASSFIANCWSKKNLRSIRRIRFIFNDNQIKGWKEIRPAWRKLVKLIQQDFTVRNLCLIINTEENYDTCLWTQDDDKLRYVYDAYCQIALDLHILDGLQDLHLEFPWFRKLEVLLEKKIMGDDYDSSVGRKRSKGVLSGLVEELPHWHAAAWEEIMREHNSVSHK